MLILMKQLSVYVRIKLSGEPSLSSATGFLHIFGGCKHLRVLGRQNVERAHKRKKI